MIRRWHALDYHVAVLVNPPYSYTDLPDADRVIVQEEWRGFPIAANVLCAEVPGDVVVVVGDDLYPIPHSTAQQIRREFLERFPDSFGVMQPTGDKFGTIDRCAVSPWIGRAFIERSYDGKGPYWMGYYHYFCDEELQAYASSLGAFQQRPDLSQYHDHWQRGEQPKRPKHLRRAKSQWAKDRSLFKERQRKGWPS
jgi:hypothetical protein